MPQHDREADTEIICAAYAERVSEAFKVFAENLGMGQGEKGCRDRFARSLELARKARDLALEVVSGVETVEPTPEHAAGAGHGEGEAPNAAQQALDQLSREDQAMIEQMLDGTTGQKGAGAPTTPRAGGREWR